MVEEKNEESTSVLQPQADGSPTISAQSINPKAVANPIRRRFRGSQVVWYILGIVEVLLALRFILKFIGANPDAGFSKFIYVISAPFAGPFVNVVGVSQVDKSIFDWTILLAMAIYGLIAWGAIKLLVMSKPVSDQEAHEELESQK